MDASDPSSLTALRKVQAALDEQLVELTLFRRKIAELQESMSTLGTTMLWFDDRLEAVGVANDALRDEQDKTAMLAGRLTR